MSKLKMIICFIVGAIVGIGIATILIIEEINNRPQLYDAMSIKDYEGGDYSPKHYYTNKTFPSVAESEKELSEVVKQPKTAYKIGYCIFASRYGEEYADGKKPFKVSLINNQVWKVTGKDTMCVVYIQKADARILRVKKYEK